MKRTSTTASTTARTTTRTTARLFTHYLGPLSLAALAFTACSDDQAATTTSFALPPRIVVTSVKDDPQSQLLAAIFARVLEDNGFRVGRKDPVALDRAGYYQAIQDGEFQIIPEFTADLLEFVYSQPGAGPAPTTVVPSGPATTQAPIIITTTTVFDETVDTGADDTSPDDTTPDDTAPDDTAPDDTAVPDTTVPATTVPDTTAAETTTTVEPEPVRNGRSIVEQITALNAGLPSTLVVSNGAAAESKLVLACTPAAMTAAAGSELITLTNLASIAPTIRLGASEAFWAEGLFERYYGGEFEEEVVVERAELEAAITDDTVDCVALDSLDPLITTKRLRILVDDQLMVPTNAVIALMASTSATPDAMFVFDTLAVALTTERLNQMLNQVVNNGANPVVVANAFVDTL